MSEDQSLPNENATECHASRCIHIYLMDEQCKKLDVTYQCEFTDSKGTVHTVDFKDKHAHLTGLPAGMGKLRWTGKRKDLAEACGFAESEDGTPKFPAKYCPDCVNQSLGEQAPPHNRHKIPYGKLMEGLPLEVPNTAQCLTHIVEIFLDRVDWCVVMAFMDNHSGTVHGSGHAGAFIIDGQSNQGRYVDFGGYNILYKDGTTTVELGGKRPETMDMSKKIDKEMSAVRISAPENVQFGSNGRLVDAAFVEIWQDVNTQYGSGITSDKMCWRIGTGGPEHEHKVKFFPTYYKSSPDFFRINGIVGWAAFRLKKGAYAAMLAYAEKTKAYTLGEFQKLITRKTKGKDSAPEPNDVYSLKSFNCMTYAITVLEQGLYPERTIKADFTQKYSTFESRFGPDHPNDHIKHYMDLADDKGYFHHRLALGMNEAVTNKPQQAVKAIRHNASLNMAYK